MSKIVDQSISSSSSKGVSDIVTVVADGRQISRVCRRDSEKFTGTCQKCVRA